MAQGNLSDRKFKQALKEALADTLQEQRGLLHDVFAEVLEDFALAEAIRAGPKTKPATREEVYAILAGWGRANILDWLIVAELALVACAQFLYTFLSLVRGHLLDARPQRVLDLIHQLGWRGAGIVLAASITAVAHGWLMLAAVDLFPRQGGLAWLLQAACWTSGLFLATFFFRLLGLTTRKH